jgi:hypothetical protein
MVMSVVSNSGPVSGLGSISALVALRARSNVFRRASRAARPSGVASIGSLLDLGRDVHLLGEDRVRIGLLPLDGDDGIPAVHLDADDLDAPSSPMMSSSSFHLGTLDVSPYLAYTSAARSSNASCQPAGLSSQQLEPHGRAVG